MSNYWYISPSGSDSNSGNSTSTPLATLGQAITNASNGDIVYFMDGTYTYTTTVTINKEVTIMSLNGKNNVILSKTTGGDFLSIMSNNVTVTDITIQSSATNTADSLISITSGTSGTNTPTKYSNINITNNILKMYKYGVTINGGNITITGNSFTRNGGTERLSLFLVYYIRDTITISNNTHLDTLRTQRFVYLTSAGTSGSNYLDRINSKGGTLIINNNTINTSANTTQKPVMFIQDYYNTYNYGAIGSDGDYNSNTKLDITMDGNNMVGNSTSLCDFFATYLTSTTCLNSYSKVTLINNTISNANIGILKLDAPSSLTINNSIIELTYLFYIYSNTITNFALRSDYVGDKTVSQNASINILPANIYLLENTSFISTIAPKQNQTITFASLGSHQYSPTGIISLSATASSGLPISYTSTNTNVVDVSGNTLIIKGVGNADITASQSGDSTYNAALDVSQNLVISKAVQTITFNVPNDPTYILSAYSSSGLPVTYTSSDTSIAKIENNNKVVFYGNGIVNITASQSGDSNYNAADNKVREFIKESIGNTNYQNPISVTSFANNLISNSEGTLTINLQDIQYSPNTGIAYGVDTGFESTIAIVNIIALAKNGVPITDFSTDNLKLNLNLPQADPNYELLMFKLDSNNQKLNPQPNGFPLVIVHVSNTLWKASVPSLSKFLIQSRVPSTLTNFYTSGIVKTRLPNDPPFNFTLTDPSSNSVGSFNYTSSNGSVATVSGNVVTVYTDGSSNIIANQLPSGIYDSGMYYSGSISTTLLVSNICFILGTLIKLDQGFISIEKINPDIHTINGKKIIAITQTISTYDFLICFEKHSLGNNIPSQKTIMTHGHEVFFKGKMRKAIECMEFSENIYKVKYRGEVLYNVLMEKHETMNVHNIICETLHPENPIAKLYYLLKTSLPEQQKRFVKEYNEHIIKNNKFSSKQLKHLNKCL